MALATGLGKTRLAGAAMAFLWLTNEARTFLLVAPRRAVLRRLADAFKPSFREYIFVDPNLVPEPYIVRSEEVDSARAMDFDPDEQPVIFLLSNQVVASSERFLEKSDFTEESLKSRLARQRGLVAIVDEAHHVGGMSEKDYDVWGRAIADLSPCLELDMTATPRRSKKGDAAVSVLYEYPLRRALAEGLYTKRPQLLVKHFSDAWTDDDIDHAAIDYVLERLQVKREAIAAVDAPPFPDVRPVGVVFAQSIDHATALQKWIVEAGRLTGDEIYLTHSGLRKSDDELDELLTIEQFGNRIRLVINVQELVEGWDVTNVYVVAPLRQMATFTGALQSIGRGLRLPAGRRVENDDADTLDVPCFGRTEFQRIFTEATEWSGSTAPRVGGLDVRPFDEPGSRYGRVEVEVVKHVSVRWAPLDVVRREMRLDLGPEALDRVTQTVVNAIELARARVRVDTAAGHARLTRDRFIDATVSRTLRILSERLTDVAHGPILRERVIEWLARAVDESGMVPYDPVDVADEMARVLREAGQAEPAEYRRAAVDAGPLEPRPHALPVQLPEDGAADAVVSLVGLPTLEPDRSNFVKNQPYRGWGGDPWQQAVHAAYAFESSHEAKTAILLDQAAEVDWWWRNDPKALRIPTPAGITSPDVIVRMTNGQILLLEVKGATFYDREAELKAYAAHRWALLQSEATGCEWAYRLAYEPEVDRCESWPELEKALYTPDDVEGPD
jgi:superfamily II DNA or RNA helicase